MSTAASLRMIDMNKKEMPAISQAEAANLIALGYAREFGTKRRIHGVRLRVPMARVAGLLISRTYTASSYATRYVFREKLSSPKVNAFVYRHKKMHPDEDPNVALERMMRAPALESSSHCLKRSIPVECPYPNTAAENASAASCAG